VQGWRGRAPRFFVSVASKGVTGVGDVLKMMQGAAGPPPPGCTEVVK
jgi:hypothetical protein